MTIKEKLNNLYKLEDEYELAKEGSGCNPAL